MAKRLTFQEQEIKFNKAHNNKYKYDASTYIKTSIKMRIICPIHGEFWQNPSNHIKGCGCPKCGKLTAIDGFKLSPQDQLIRFKKIHGDKYEYDWSTYINTSTKMKMICPIHGEFLQSPHIHGCGTGCPKCGLIKRAKSATHSLERVEIAFIKAHSNNYTYYWNTYKNITTKMKMKCNKCDYEFYLSPDHHKRGVGCCNCIISNGEDKIKYILIENNKEFVQQKRFIDCKHKKQLPFDFYLPELNVCIEFDGIQHHEFPNHWHKTYEEFVEQQLKDKIKTEYCKNNNIQLIRIPYWDFDNVEKILNFKILTL